MNYQRIIVAGNVTSDALYNKSMKSGKEYTIFNVVVKGYKKERPTYFRVAIFGIRAKPLAEYLNKGRQVLVEGKIVTDPEGRFSVIADNIELGTHVDSHYDKHNVSDDRADRVHGDRGPAPKEGNSVKA